jgi:hypothetical protein
MHKDNISGRLTGEVPLQRPEMFSLCTTLTNVLNIPSVAGPPCTVAVARQSGAASARTCILVLTRSRGWNMRVEQVALEAPARKEVTKEPPFLVSCTMSFASLLAL